MTEFANDLFSVAYPTGWVALEHEDHSGLLLANSESGLDRYRRSAALESGDQLLKITLTPAELFQVLQISIEPGASVETLSEAILSRVDETDGAQASAPEIMTLEDGRPVALRKAINDTTEGATTLFEVTKGIIALNTVAACPGEYQEFEPSALAILTSLAFGGTVEALTATIDPTPPMDGPVR